jgi:hypothetical protein
MRAIRAVAVVALLATTAFARFGPPWISIEYPANPYDAASRGAFLLVHAFHHGQNVAFPVSGTAEGLVNGARRTVNLEFRATSRPGVYALHKQWDSTGVWTLVLAVRQGDGDGNTAQAAVELAASGQVAAVNVPTRRQGQWLVPTGVAMRDVEAGLRSRTAQLAAR